jgi:hypothetical protein
MPDKFGALTSRLIKRLPYWWKARRQPTEAVAGHFLNVVGLEFEDAKYILDYAMAQLHILTADIEQADICYKTSLPELVTKDNYITVSSIDGIQISPAKNLTEFFGGFSTLTAQIPELLLQHTYYIDWTNRLLYTKFTYNRSEECPDGRVNVVIFKSDGNILGSSQLKLNIHHVWNFFDEFGLLLCCPRIRGERNIDYKERILDVMKHPGGASIPAMINGISREVLFRFKEIWNDGSKNFVLRRPYTAPHTIMIDGYHKVTESEYKIDGGHRVVLFGKKNQANIKSIVTYDAGVELRTFWYKNDLEFMKELYVPDGDASMRLRYYAQLIKDQVPIEWGQFKWNQGFWDSFLPTKSGRGCLPSFCDGSVKGWENYGGDV